MVRPKYNLIEDFVHHILSGGDVHNGLYRCGEVFYQIFMPLRAITSREANLHGIERVPSLDLRHGQRHRHTMTNTMEGDLLNVGQDVLETSINGRTPSIDGIRGRVLHQLERFELHRQGWQSQEQKYYQDKDNGNRNEAFLEFILPATMASDLANHARTALASSSAA